MKSIVDKYKSLILGEIEYFGNELTEKIIQNDFNRDSIALIPGTFNPLHSAHIDLYINGMGNKVPVFELSILNVDKGLVVTKDNIQAKVDQFNYYGFNYLITNAPTIFSKLRFANNFIIGADTFNRYLDPKYCQNNTFFLQKSLTNVNFLVYERNVELVDYSWMINKPTIVKYNNSISSTELRELQCH